MSSSKSTALSQDSDVEVKQARFKDLKEQQQLQQMDITAQDIIHKGPVWRQQAELR